MAGHERTGIIEAVWSEIEQLSPLDQIRACRELTDGRTVVELTDHGDTLVYEMTRTPGEIDKLAGELGVHRSTVEQAITRHRRRGASSGTKVSHTPG